MNIFCKPIFRSLALRFPFLKTLYTALFTPGLLSTHHLYKYSDEKLKYLHILEAFNYIRVAGVSGRLIPYSYFEFGCHSARTFTHALKAAKFLKIPINHFHAFDSFAGLPPTNEQTDGIFREGTFYTSIKRFRSLIKYNTGLQLSDYQIHKGFYSDSLTSDLSSILPKAGIIHIDVDLYSSTIEVLKFCKPHIVNGTVILFDDWYCFPPNSGKGESAAFNQFLDSNPNLQASPWKSYSTFGQSFIMSITDNFT